MFAGQLLSQALASWYGIKDLNALFLAIAAGEQLEYIPLVKTVLLLGHVFRYTVPVILFAVFFFRQTALKELYLARPPAFTDAMKYGIALILLFPFVSWVYYWNASLVPDAATAQTTLDLQQQLLQMPNLAALGLNLLLFGLAAGVGEELFFRAILQRFLILGTKNVFLGLFLAGIAFSLLHFQLEGLIPRVILGIFLGFILILTGNLWVSILVHILFNSSQVLLNYVNNNLINKANEITCVPIWMAGLSLLLFIFYCKLYVLDKSKYEFKN